ncbi:hypothetical protein M9458_005306, partial [Cirrhinus mrigala]
SRVLFKEAAAHLNCFPLRSFYFRGERQELSDVLPGTSSQTVHPVGSPMDSSQYGLDLLFGAPAEEKAGSSESEGEPSEADVTADFAAPAAESQSVDDAEMAAALQRAARETGVVWVPPPSPEPSRLDDWFLGSRRDSRPRSSPVLFFPEVHEELTKLRRAPLSARSLYANSPSLTTPHHPRWRSSGGESDCDALMPAKRRLLEGPPETPVQGLLTRPLGKLRPPCTPWLSCRSTKPRFSKTCTRMNCVQRPTMLCELRRAMSTMVVQEHHLWLNLAEMRDAEKVRFLDAPISQAGLFGETVEEFAQQGHQTHPASACSERPAPPKQQPPPAPHRGRPHNLLVLQLDPPNGPVLVGRLLRTLVRLQSIPETSSPGKRDRLTCPGPHSTRGRALYSAPTPTTWSIKEQFPSSLGIMYSTSDPLHDGRMLYPSFRTCGHTPPVFPHVLRQRARSDDSPSQRNPLLSSHGMNSLGKTASGLRGFSPPATCRFPSHDAPILGT